MSLAAAPEVVIPPFQASVLRRPAGGIIRLAGQAFATEWRLAAVVEDADGPGAAALRAAIVSVCADIDMAMSQWNPVSELSRFNAAAAGTWVPLSAHFAAVIGCALAVARASGGAFDPALGAVSDSWGFGASPAPRTLPQPVLRTFDWRALRFDAAGCLLRQPGGLRLDLSGIAKGYAVDAAMRRLQDLGIRSAMIEIGGEVAARGVKPGGQPWWVDLARAPRETGASVRIGLCEGAVASSGHWERRRSAAGRSWHHSLSPLTGAPLDDELAGAAVLHGSCMQADALATTLLVLGQEAGLAFADRHNLAARLISCSGAAVISRAWRRAAGRSCT
ncbi:FAD:protein FMN transferase [Pacificimonas flava]|uniref:FAD:protein FMN transferase n=1 Tax=Pacificimonas flava TaxID=1234595 RepID=M2TMB1_9SPHN|nr:FAD:protein FMN transferase [Pacificimonas flava]EMD82861.1 Thiamin biosynthesis lipoprotein ApbE [Pacificimonas flava]MBB5279475.1 thiamine biosynthesis lipoprotein [Pacificimonas flava]